MNQRRSTYAFADRGQRADVIRGARKCVIKVGTRLLTDIDGVSKADRITQLVQEIARLRQRGTDVVLVTSGAVGAGMKVLETRKRPASLSMLQAHAAVGQSRLMYLYETACIEHGFHCGQMLLTAADVKHRERHLNITCCLDAMLGKGLLPVINENDSVSVDEIRFGDNDVLAALVATMIRADLTVLLTTVDGMREREGQPPQFGERISLVRTVTPKLKAMALGPEANQYSTGGMVTKLRAAEIVTRAGEDLWIADGTDFRILRRVFSGDDVGTLFSATSDSRMKGHKRYLAFFSRPEGDIVVDSGAVKALVDHGRSLLPSGIVDVHGEFPRGRTVRILAEHGDEVARGVSNYSSRDIARIRGLQTSALKKVLGYEAYDEVVHRTYLVLTG